jgi:mRNA interferase RelE/StbE
LYQLVFLDKALDEFKKIDRARQKIIKAKLLILAKNPAALKNNIKRLGGPEEALYRLRIGAYRVIFKKDKARLIILIVRVGHRREVYYWPDQFIHNAKDYSPSPGGRGH